MLRISDLADESLPAMPPSTSSIPAEPQPVNPSQSPLKDAGASSLQPSPTSIPTHHRPPIPSQSPLQGGGASQQPSALHASSHPLADPPAPLPFRNQRCKIRVLLLFVAPILVGVVLAALYIHGALRTGEDDRPLYDAADTPPPPPPPVQEASKGETVSPNISLDTPSPAPPSINTAPYRHVMGASYDWILTSAPQFESSDHDLTEAYWYRWRVFHLHTHETESDGFVVTEFLPKVSWSGPHNTISCAAGHHLMEGRWLLNTRIAEDYARFWFRRSPTHKVWERMYSFWAAAAVWEMYLVTGNATFVEDLYPELEANYYAWRASHYNAHSGCMYQACHDDGQENSCGLDGCRPTINAGMYGEARALARIAVLSRRPAAARSFELEEAKWRRVLLEKLWSEELGHFVTYTAAAPAALLQEKKAGRIRTIFGCMRCPAGRTWPPEEGWPDQQRVSVRELMGLTSPWYYAAIPADNATVVAKYAAAFQQLSDPSGFHGEWGPRTCERRHPCYNFSTTGTCNWNGGSWPFETSKVGTAIINLLHRYPPQPYVQPRHFQELLRIYARSHTRSFAAGPDPPPHIDEDLHPDAGYWITRNKLWNWYTHNSLTNRGQHYLHSSFNDLVLSGLVGIHAPSDEEEVHGVLVKVRPLVDPQQSDGSGGIVWFIARGVHWRGRILDVAYDHSQDGAARFEALGRGLHVWLDGQLAFSGMELPGKAVLVYHDGKSNVTDEY